MKVSIQRQELANFQNDYISMYINKHFKILQCRYHPISTHMYTAFTFYMPKLLHKNKTYLCPIPGKRINITALINKMLFCTLQTSICTRIMCQSINKEHCLILFDIRSSFILQFKTKNELQIFSETKILFLEALASNGN